jgi:exodeoxyribonuclease VII small subunit
MPEPAHDADDLPDDLTYSTALAELEALLDQLEDGEIDIDALSSQVRHAAALIRFCRRRLADARLEVEQIVDDLEADEASFESSD